MDRVYFKEIQKFGSIPLYIAMGLIYFFVLGLNFYALIDEFVYDGDAIDGHLSSNGLIIFTILLIVIIIGSGYLLFASKLITEVTTHSIKYRFPPFIKKSKIVERGNISTWEVRKYKPIREYSGWGIKYGSKKKGFFVKKLVKQNSAINVKGNIGLQLVLKNGDRLLIGTQRQEAIRRAMKKMYNNK